MNTWKSHWRRLTEHPWLLVELISKRLKSWIFQATNGLKLLTILIMISKFLYISDWSQFLSNYHCILASTDTQQSQQIKVYCLLEVIVVLKSLRLLATTVQGGANWMTYNQLVTIIVQSPMAIKFMSLAEVEHSKFWIWKFLLSQKFWLLNFFFATVFLRYTEIWSNNEGSKNIKLAQPKLTDYVFYPELILVDTQFCVKSWIKYQQ